MHQGQAEVADVDRPEDGHRLGRHHAGIPIVNGSSHLCSAPFAHPTVIASRSSDLASVRRRALERAARLSARLALVYAPYIKVLPQATPAKLGAHDRHLRLR